MTSSRTTNVNGKASVVSATGLASVDGVPLLSRHSFALIGLYHRFLTSAKLGCKQELRRNISMVEVFGIAFSIMGGVCVCVFVRAQDGTLMFYFLIAKAWFTRPKITIATDGLIEKQQVAIREEWLNVQSVMREELCRKNKRKIHGDIVKWSLSTTSGQCNSNID